MPQRGRDAVVLRDHHQKAQHGDGKRQNGYAGAYGGQAGPFFGQDQLGLVDY